MTQTRYKMKHHKEPNELKCHANQINGSYIRGALAFNGIRFTSLE